MIEYECENCGRIHNGPVFIVDNNAICETCYSAKEETVNTETKISKYLKSIKKDNFKSAMARFVAAGPKAMDSHDYDSFAGCDGDGYIAEDETGLMVMDVTKDSVTIEAYGLDGDPSTMFILEGKVTVQTI